VPGLAKLSEPRAREVFDRPRVTRLLDAAARHRLVWVSGPAGSGKTTAVQSWLAARRRARCWYHVDGGDVDAANLFHYLSRAVKQPMPVMSLEVSIDAFARRFFEAWFGHARRILVLDDLHAAHNGLDGVLRVACDAVPDGTAIVVISRDEPPPELARAFASRDAARVDWDALRMTATEARGMSRALSRKQLPPQRIVDGLHALTDGWPVGLALLLAYPSVVELAELERDAIARQLREHDGAQRVFDYIASEVFEREDEATRRLLLLTAVLPIVTDERARILTGSVTARTTLRRLEAGGLFVKREAPGVWRYHPLFRAFLLQRAETQLPADGLADLRRRAGLLLVAGGELETGFALLLQTRDWPACAGVIERGAAELFAQGRRVTLRGWLAALPEDVVHGSPWLLFWSATCALAFDPFDAIAQLGEAFARFRGDGELAGARLAWSSRVAACVHAGTDLSPIDGWLVELDALDPRGGESASFGHLLALFRQPGHPHAVRWIRDASESWRATPDPSARAMTAALLVAMHCFSGELGHAATVLDALRHGERDVDPLAAITHCNGEAVFAWVTADHTACLAAVARGLAFATDTGIVAWNDQLAGIGAAAALASGDLTAAAPFIARMADAASRGTSFAIGNHQFYVGWEAVLRGDLPRAQAAIDVAVERADRYGYPFAQVTSRIALAHVLTRRGFDPRPALAAAREQAEAARSAFLELSCAFAEACLTDDEGALVRAFGSGRALGIYNVFSWFDEPMVGACERALARGIETDYVVELIRRHGLAAPESCATSTWPYPVKLRALGRLDIETSVPKPKKAAVVPLRLLAAIIALGGRDVPEARLVEALWPDADGAAGRTVLHTTLHRLRRMLGHDDAIRFRAGAIDLDSSIVWLDVWAAERACARIERGDIDSVQALMDAYVGPLLGDDDALSCVVAARLRLHGRITRAVLSAGAILETRGELARARAVYESAIDRDASELVYQRLMTCLDKSGEAAAALQVFLRCKAMLTSQGLGLSQATREIHVTLQRRNL
jgi:DNA-binding SARP family transcriptional activator